MENRDDYKLGLCLCIGAYIIWGLFPLYWKLMQGAGSWEVIAHRIAWTPLYILAYVLYRGELPKLLLFIRSVLNRRILPWLAAASLIACLNYWINVYATLTEHVVELGIGTFMTPILSIFFGMLCFKERLNRIELASVALALAGLAVMMLGYGRLPWIALGVSLTWALYGVIKKYLKLNGTGSVFVETMLVVPFALSYLVYLWATGDATFSFADKPTVTCALLGVAFVTCVPLVFYSFGATMIPLSVLGFIQYINPVMTVSVGVFLLGESISATEVKALCLIGVAVILFMRSQYVNYCRDVRGSKTHA